VLPPPPEKAAPGDAAGAYFLSFSSLNSSDIPGMPWVSGTSGFSSLCAGAAPGDPAGAGDAAGWAAAFGASGAFCEQAAIAAAATSAAANLTRVIGCFLVVCSATDFAERGFHSIPRRGARWRGLSTGAGGRARRRGKWATEAGFSAIVPAFVRIALLADVHANLEALTACLAHAEEQGAETHAFLGDLVGYGPDPAPVLDRIAELASRGAVVVKGNHDAASLTDDETLTPAAARAVAWTRDQLQAHHRAFLAGLPLTAEREGALYVHASADAPAAWTYVSDPARAAASLRAAGAATWVFSGHVHEQALYFARGPERPIAFRPTPGTAVPVETRRRWLAIVGSVGQPRDGNTAACYALFDRGRATLTFHRVPYDWAAAAAKVRRAGLPARLAHRLEYGE